MRRPALILVSCVVLHLALPSPALAWWDFFEQFSGPGRFYGWDIQTRLFCLIDEIPVKDAAGNRDSADKKTQTRAVIPTTIGIITSTCRAEEVDTTNMKKYKHRLSVDIAARFLWADDNPRFANGQRISLTTLEPVIWVALLNKFDKGDILSYGVGVGTYWFSSTEFPSFNGAFIEPVRLELHAPFVWRKHAWSAAIPRFQLGLATFPGGFETSAFAASPDVQPRISRDWVWNGAIAFDLSPVLKKLAP